jgi:aminoglycoside phosphotransferase (APT) family kinase protein
MTLPRPDHRLESRAVSAPSEPAKIPGLSAAPLEAWLVTHLPAGTPPFSYERIAGGRSNLTFRVHDAAGRAWILRRPPQGETLGSAHDMAREYRVLAGLARTGVPAPTPVAYCEDLAVVGAPFYLMELVEGVVLRRAASVDDAFPERADRRRIGEAVVDTLVGLHQVDPDAAGLGTLGRRDGYTARQLKRWYAQWEATKTRELTAMDEAHRLLCARVPEQKDVAIIHGDYRVDNLIVSATGDVAAVVDWELCTLGDPLADLGLLVVYWAEPGDDIVPLADAPTLAAGFPTRRELAERYAERSGRDIAELDYFVALGYWKLAAILEGVSARYAAGAYGPSADEFASFVGIVDRLADAGLETIRRLER